MLVFPTPVKKKPKTKNQKTKNKKQKTKKNKLLPLREVGKMSMVFGVQKILILLIMTSMLIFSTCFHCMQEEKASMYFTLLSPPLSSLLPHHTAPYITPHSTTPTSYNMQHNNNLTKNNTSQKQHLTATHAHMHHTLQHTHTHTTYTHNTHIEHVPKNGVVQKNGVTQKCRELHIFFRFLKHNNS
jgi:hypothetical protein